MAYSNRRSWAKKPNTYVKPEPVPFQRPTFTPSPYQSAIVDAINQTSSSIIIDAVAGSGKTSTLQLIVAAILDASRSYVVIAFNKSIATTLQERGMNGRTFHSLGFNAVRYALKAHNNGIDPQMDAQKVSRIVDDTFPNREADGFSSALIRLVSLAKNHIMRPTASDDDIISLIEHFDIEWDDETVNDAVMASHVRAILARNNDDTRTIDFDDQLYFVELFNLRLSTFDFVLVDESQDTNPLRRALIRRMMHNGTRVIAVGDERQAIYGFTGASHDSMDLIANTFNCVRYPLSVSYRCPTSVVNLARTIVPQIEARPNAPDGSVLRPKTFRRSDFLPTDLLVCRNTAPLVATAYKLLASRTPCRIMGREIGASLTSLIKKLTRRQETLESLADRLMAYRATETEKAMKQKKETKAQAITDKVDAILAIIDSLTPEDADQGIPRLIAIIDGMFSDQKNGCTTLATVHKAKGLEAPRVFILDPHLMPSKMAKQDWQQQQERNLMYVAYTRALDTLVFVDTKTLTD